MKVFSAVFVIVVNGFVLGQSGGDFVIKNATLEGGGHTSSGGSFVTEIRLGQGLAGQSLSGGSFAVGGGFYPSPPPPPPPTQPPAVPLDLSATAVSRTEIDLAWTDNSDNESGFLIELCGKGKNCTTSTEIGRVDAGVTTFSHTGRKPGTEYKYRVRAFNSVGNSGYSNVAAAKTPRR